MNNSWIIQPLLGQITTKPPLCRWVIPCCTTKFYINIIVQTKVVFTGNSFEFRLELTAGKRAVRVKKVGVLKLPKRYCSALSSGMSSNIHVFNWETHTFSWKSHDVKIAELSPDVISVINRFNLVEAASSSPVSGATADVFHPSQSLAVWVPIWGILVDRSILHKWLALKLRQVLQCAGPGHD